MPKLKSGYSKISVARAILTETLPYEMPLFFTNIHLYQRLSTGQPSSPLAEKILGITGETIACKFPVFKRPAGTRELGLMHPSAQSGVADFYGTYDEFIAQLCRRSSFSLRYPIRAASRYFDSRFASIVYNNEIELDEVSYEQQSSQSSSYFAYRRYSQIYKFYDSKEFLDLEQKYRYMLRVDISKCFSSIYTHSISWAVRGKLFGKKMKAKRGSVFFEDDFDRLMRELNWGETNGLLVGPEVSRLFCEIILQGIDVAVESKIVHGVCVRRYMDDYFIFGSNEEACVAVEKIVAVELATYNLFLNENKRELSVSPLVTSLSVARQRVNDHCSTLMEILGQRINYATRTIDVAPLSDAAADSEMLLGHHQAANAAMKPPEPNSAEAAVREIRAISRQYSVEYSGLVAPSLAVIGRKLNKICADIASSKKKIEAKHVANTQADLATVLRICEFLYLSDVRSSTSNKIARIFLEIAEICRRLGIGSSFVELQMLDAVRKALSVWRDASLLDVVNAVVAVQVIASGERGLTQEDVRGVLERKADQSMTGVSYLRVVTGLFLCANRPRLQRLKQQIISELVPVIQNTSTKSLREASVSMLVLDFLSCPHVPIEIRAVAYQGVAKGVFAPAGIDVAAAKGAVKRIGAGVRFTDWSVEQGSLEGLRRLLEKTELRLAYD